MIQEIKCLIGFHEFGKEYRFHKWRTNGIYWGKRCIYCGWTNSRVEYCTIDGTGAAHDNYNELMEQWNKRLRYAR
jgi:hypothetical protein